MRFLAVPAPRLDLAGMRDFSYVESKNIEDMLNPVPAEIRYLKGNSILYSKPLSADTINAVDKWMNAVPAGATRGYLILALWGGKESALNGRKDTAFPHRDTLIGFEFVVEWGASNAPGEPLCQDCITWINSCFVRCRG
jgi:hypothetical protein